MVFVSQSQFTFTCPIFNAETKMQDCMKLRDLHWRGQRPSVRKGCQACMHAGKCPAARIMQKVAFIKHYSAAEYSSETPVKGKLYAEELERIENVVVLESTLNAFAVPLVERNLIHSADDRIAQQLASAPRTAPKRAVMAGTGGARRRSVSRRVVEKPVENIVETPKVNTAAATGDLAAAINGGGA